jgi:hypothetical protein
MTVMRPSGTRENKQTNKQFDIYIYLFMSIIYGDSHTHKFKNYVGGT